MGDLFDWPTHRFTGQSLFSNELPENFSTKTDKSESDDQKKFYKDSSYFSKFVALEIESVDTQFSLVSSTFPFAGWSKFFTHRVINEKTIQRFWTFVKRRFYKEISLLHGNVMSYIDNTTLLNTDATHVAIGIHYGIRAIISLDNKLTYNQTQNWGLVLEEILSIIRNECGSGNILTKTQHDDMENYINYNYYSDYTPNDEPNNLHEAVQQCRQSYIMTDENQLKPITGL